MKVSDLTPGALHEQVLVEALTRTQLVMYAGASGDYNPLHTDEVYAVEVAGMKTVLAHGALSMGLTAQAAAGWVDEAEVTGLSVRFLRQVWPGDTLTATLSVTSLDLEASPAVAEVSLSTVNQDGQPVLTGSVRLRDAR